MNIKNRIIKHYKKFFDLHAKGVVLDEDDHLNIDWAEDLVKNCFIPNVSISSLAEKAKEEERLNREKMIINYNAPLDKIQPYENKHFINLVDTILKELKN